MPLASTDNPGRLHRLLDADGVGIILTDDLLPDFLRQANARVLAGEVEAARGLLTDDGIAWVERKVDADPTRTDLMYVLAKLLRDTGRTEAAIAWYRRIVATEPHVQVLWQLGELLRPVQAVACLREAHQRAPQHDGVLRSYAHSLFRAGRIPEGIEQLKKLRCRLPDIGGLQLRILWHQHYLPGYDDAYFKTAYTRWVQRFMRVEHLFGQYPQSRQPGRRLKLGLISGEFKTNSPLTSFELIFTLLDPSAFELYAYSNVSEPNEGTQRWQKIVDVYRDIRGIDDVQAAHQIHEDRIDILMEVGGFCQESRLGVMAYQPAPLQVDYGALSTTGLPEVQYRFSCPLLTPPEARQDYTETTLYLSPLCPYAPPDKSPLVGPLPAKTNGFLTFGVFNNHRKINALCLDLWAEVMRLVPGSRLLMKFPEGGDPDLARDYRQALQQRGIAAERVTVLGPKAHMEHLALIGRCDLMLDTFPYNAARGTMEALWMGVPTVTMVGDSFVAREGLAIQAQVGLAVFAARTPEQYVDKAVQFAQQCDHLDTIRQSLRQRMLGSPLCDPRGWTQAFAQALRNIWMQYCQTHPAPEGEG